MGDQTFPGLTRTQVLELLPELEITEEQGQILTEEGWFRMDHLETQEELTARVKICVNLFKDMAKTQRGKTVFAVSHGQFLHNLIVHLISGGGDPKMLASGMMNPHNNALTIIDFDV